MAAVRLDSNSFTQLITADHIDHVTKAASCLLLPGLGIRHFQKSDAPTLGYPRLKLTAYCQQLLAKKKGNSSGLLNSTYNGLQKIHLMVSLN
jgi:hypothetical protein